jgi:hypothetical protein
MRIRNFLVLLVPNYKDIFISNGTIDIGHHLLRSTHNGRTARLPRINGTDAP